MYKQIRSHFLDFFKAKDHLVLPSSSIIPNNDPTLMFTNSGMVQFKNVFLGFEKPAYKNVTTVQKSLRAGGKHNDLDNVGYTARHHTFFEMLGNFSFTGYFKEQAIVHAWDFLTKEVKLPKEKLYITVFHDDDEAFGVWKRVLGGEERIIRIASNDNFWMMGDTGPCGPCSEIFYDYGEKVAGGKPGTSEQDGDRFCEIWNLVFMQFNQENGVRMPLGQTAIDTGMGLERLVSVLEGKTDNYDTSLFLKLRKGIAEIYGCEAFGKDNTACRVVADHIRAISFLVAEGITPSNEGRGYVLRRIMRRAMRYLHQINDTQAKMHNIVDFLDEEMGEAYHELRRAVPVIKDVIQTEEKNFKQMLDRGLRILDEDILKINGKILAGDVAFKLYDTYGFPLDLTQDILRQNGLSVDEVGFEKALQCQREMSKANWRGSGDIADDKIWFELKEKFGETEFLGYEDDLCEAKLLALVGDWAVFDKTVCYPEGGGQVGDVGYIFTGLKNVEIVNTKKMVGGVIAHQFIDDGIGLDVGKIYMVRINTDKRNGARKHHSATHLLQAALQRNIGIHIAQKGSKVMPDRLTFDFSHNKALTLTEIAKVEADVNDKISQGLAVVCKNMAKVEAEKLGAMALFGEKYGEFVRVVQMGERFVSLSSGTSGEEVKCAVSIELCGGTHVKNTSNIGLFKIVSESSIASGVRRIEAVAGESAWGFINRKLLSLENISDMTKAHAVKNSPDEFDKFIAEMVEKSRAKDKEIERLQIEVCIAKAKAYDDVVVVEGKFGANVIREAVVGIKKFNQNAIIIGVAINENGATYVVDIGSGASLSKAVDLVQKIQIDVGVASIKQFVGKMLIFGGKYVTIL